ncbi:phosphotransferase [Thalassobacillus hwangdonensis]|uniref:Phosphotransferase n=2 Tax=Thalassobacillus hwangdonensis TaxID=546108 RepID=A0ABW3L0L3_9BACI
MHEHGALGIDDIKAMKLHVFKIRCGNQFFALKAYSNPAKLEQQHLFFKEWEASSSYGAAPIAFPNGLRYVEDGKDHWGLFEWIDGEALNFRYKRDRQEALKFLYAFHTSCRGTTKPIIQRSPLYIKFERRAEVFNDTRPLFRNLGREHLYEDIAEVCDITLRAFRNENWKGIHEKAHTEKSWIHGDVAHHNFIRTDTGEIKLIDFDLLQMGPEVYEFIQLGQRYLHHIDHSWSKLTSLFRDVPNKKQWLKGLLVPSDFMREWIHLTRRFKDDYRRMDAELVEYEQMWQERKRFVEKVLDMLS